MFIASALLENGGLARDASSSSFLKEAIHVISCGYEDKTEWGKEISLHASLVFSALFDAMAGTGILKTRWGGAGMDDWYRNVHFCVISGVSAHLFALYQGLLKVLAGVNTDFTVTSKEADDGEYSELYLFKWTSLLLPPLTLLIINIFGFAVGISVAINNIGHEPWGPLFVKLFFAFWVILHLYPFLQGMMGRQDKLPTIIIVWAILLSSILSFVWIQMNPSYDVNLSLRKLWKMSFIVPK